MNLLLFLLKHILLSIAWNLIVVGSILYELIQCVKGICIHFLIYLVINFVSLIQKHTIISKRKHLLHFTTKVFLIKVLWWAIFILQNLRVGRVVQFRVHDFLRNVPNHVIKKVIWYATKLQIFEILCNISSCLCPVLAVSVLCVGMRCVNIRKFITSSHIK